MRAAELRLQIAVQRRVSSSMRIKLTPPSLLARGFADEAEIADDRLMPPDNKRIEVKHDGYHQPH